MRVLRRRSVIPAALAALALTAPAAPAAVGGSTTGSQVTITDNAFPPTANTITGVGCGLIADTIQVIVAVNGGFAYIAQPDGCEKVTSIIITMGDDADTVIPTIGTSLLNVNIVGVQGGPGNDRLIGGNKTTTMAGDTGDDIFEPVLNGTGVNGQSGIDTIRATGANYTLTNSQLTGTPATTMTSIERAELTGSDGSGDTIDASAFSGAVVLTGLDGNDHLLAGAGGGTLVGGPGADDLDGGAGNDVLDGGAGDDLLTSVAGDDQLLGGDGGDQLDAGDGTDLLDAGAGNDALAAGPGDDRLLPGPGDDSTVGGEGIDALEVTADANLTLAPTTLTGDGTDTLDTLETAALTIGPGGHTIDATSWILSTRLTGGPANDILLGGSGPDVIRGGGGDDLVRGNLGSDDLGGDSGSDTLSYAGYANPVTVALGAASGGPAVNPDTLVADFEHLEGGSAADRLTGNDAPNALNGGPGDDILDGRAGADALVGGAGNDALLGGPGGPGDGDAHIGGDGIDMVNYAGRTGGVRVTVGVGADDGSPGENDDVRADIETVVGSQAGDVIIAAPAPAGGAASLRLLRAFKPLLVAGLGGADRIIGGPGNDALGGGAGDDTVEGGPGNDVVAGGSGADLLKGLGGNDRLYGHAGADKLESGDGDDVVFSLDKGLDRIRCGLGKDLLLADVKDIPALARLALLKSAANLKPSTTPITARSDCDRAIGKTTAPSAPGATPSGGNQTCDDGDDIWDDEGDGGGCEEPPLPGEPAQPGGWTEDSGGQFAELVNGVGEDFDFDAFGAEFDDSFFGSGFDDPGDAFGEDLGGTNADSTGPRVATKSAKLDKRRRAALAVSCPKRAQGRCIGELEVQRPAKGKRKASLLGRSLFSIPKGKKRTLRIRLTKQQAKRLSKARKGTQADVIIEARDSGSQLWQTTGTVKLRRR